MSLDWRRPGRLALLLAAAGAAPLHGQDAPGYERDHMVPRVAYELHLLEPDRYPAPAWVRPWITVAGDTLRLEVGSPEIDARFMPAHRARNRVYVGNAETPVRSWTNELQLGDSAGRPVHRWITRGENANGTWELLQTYDARTLAPLAYLRTSSDGARMHLRIDGQRVRGTQRLPGDSVERPVDVVIERPGFIASASDLVPMAVRLEPGLVITASVWGPTMDASEERVFTVIGEEPVTVEGSEVTAWRVEERRAATGALYATWWITFESPFMVLAEIVLPAGGVQRITGEALEGPG